MDLLHPLCAGLDVHKDTVVACLRRVVEGRVKRELRTFGTTTRELLELSDWLASQGCRHVAMEATGVYWKPVWHILSDGDVELVLANARHVKNVPGRKSDVSDAAWQSDLLAHGLIRASFVPDGATQELRGLLRTRKQLVQERTRHIQRLQKTLEDANIKLDSTISDLLGRSGRAMIEALIAGETDPDKLAALADGRIKASQARLREALRGRVTKQHLRQIDGLSEGIADIDREVETRIEPFRKAVELLSSIPGVSTLSAQVIIAEIGLDMSRFPTVGHLLSWAGLCPKSDESAGKRRSTRMRKGAPWLKTNLIQCAWAAKNAKRTYLQAQFYRVRARRGDKKAAGAVAASILTAAYHMLQRGVFYQDLGPEHFERSKAAQAKRLVKRLKNLGYAAALTPIAA